MTPILWSVMLACVFISLLAALPGIAALYLVLSMPRNRAVLVPDVIPKALPAPIPKEYYCRHINKFPCWRCEKERYPNESDRHLAEWLRTCIPYPDEAFEHYKERKLGNPVTMG